MTQAMLAGATMPRMLIADDDPSVVRVLADWCSKAGFAVDTAADGLQALIKAKRSCPDILMIDLEMPGASGLSVTARLLDQARHLNVVLITGNNDFETLERCEGLGVSYVRKGVEFWGDLIHALSEIFPLMIATNVIEKNLRPPRGITGSRPRVLIIDDDPSVPQFLGSRLNKFSVDALFAPSAPLGFRIASREQPNVIISDYAMPDGDIYYLLAKLRTTSATENIPVFVWTGRKLTETDRHMLRRDVCGHPGAAQILEKSVGAAELFSALQPLIPTGTAEPNFGEAGVYSPNSVPRPDYFSTAPF